MRIFIALPLPDHFKQKLINQTALLRERRKDLRWVPEKNLHVTLAFLGELKQVGTDLATAAMRRCAEKAHPFCIEADGLLTFPSKGRFRVLAAKISRGERECAALASMLETELAVEGQSGAYIFRKPERRPFAAHITVARAAREECSLSAEERSLHLRLSENVSVVAIFSSTFENGSIRYSELGRIPLGNVRNYE
ncbi:MAG: RNA 2',3'-cyclic phosphodiesterase [Treponemataceae bacterium]